MFEGIVTILLIVLLFLLYIMLTTSNTQDYNWEVAGSGPVSNIHLGENGTLYAFMGTRGNAIYAIDNNGTVRWKYQVQAQWNVINKLFHGFPPSSDLSYSPDEPVFATHNGTLYL